MNNNNLPCNQKPFITFLNNKGRVSPHVVFFLKSRGTKNDRPIVKPLSGVRLKSCIVNQFKSDGQFFYSVYQQSNTILCTIHNIYSHGRPQTFYQGGAQ